MIYKRKSLIPFCILVLSLTLSSILYSYHIVYVDKVALNAKEFWSLAAALTLPFTLMFVVRGETKHGPDNLTINETTISFGPEKKRHSFEYKAIEKAILSDDRKSIDFVVDSKRMNLNTRRYVWDADKVIVPLLETLNKNGIKLEVHPDA